VPSIGWSFEHFSVQSLSNPLNAALKLGFAVTRTTEGGLAVIRTHVKPAVKRICARDPKDQLQGINQLRR
jgi:hypothetical protein